MDNDRIILAHGGGGELTRRLLAERILPRLSNDLLAPLTDAAVLPRPAADLCFTTDAYVVQPLEFPGADIGRLCICGTVNDLAMMGARPLAMSLALVIEEGLEIGRLEKIVDSIAAAAKEAGVRVATGDTKVVEHGRGDGLVIATAGVGERMAGAERLGAERIETGDAIVINGRIADHGLAVMSARKGIEFQTDIRSDAAPLNGLVAAMLETGADIRFLRDPTRGGLAGLLADLAEATGRNVELEELAVPLSPAARHASEMLGLDPLAIANEGKVVAVVAAADAEKVLAVCRAHRLGARAAVIGHVLGRSDWPLVELVTRGGGRRIVQRPYGEELPRIC
jgi:hydrogenase expression/formation protein HypE